jgi:hypothetical protein
MVAEEWQRIPKVHPHVFQPEKVEGNAEGSLATGSLGAVIGQFKKRSTRRIRARRYAFIWQDRFFDQILRDKLAVERYRAYIRENPIRWQPPQS